MNCDQPAVSFRVVIMKCNSNQILFRGLDLYFSFFYIYIYFIQDKKKFQNEKKAFFFSSYKTQQNI